MGKEKILKMIFCVQDHSNTSRVCAITIITRGRFHTKSVILFLIYNIHLKRSSAKCTYFSIAVQTANEKKKWLKIAII